MTDQLGREHDVSTQEFGAGHAAGVYRGLCGALITPVALTAAPGDPCAACILELDPIPEARARDPHTQRRVVAAWLRRLPTRASGSRAPALTPSGGVG